MDIQPRIAVLTLLFLIFCLPTVTKADELQRLHQAYPECIHRVSSNYIAWQDGTRMPISGSFPLLDRITGFFYGLDYSRGSISRYENKRDRFEPVMRKMYGNSAREVKQKLVTIYWMPKVFGKEYPLRVTTINGVDQKLRRISAELEKLPPSYFKYLAKPAGGFYWRNVKGEGYLSSHSFGIAIDINSTYSNYWLWDFLKKGRPISELRYHKVSYQNQVPMKIVQIFEKEGFFWGGRWYFYDTMHFEYRPEYFAAMTS